MTNSQPRTANGRFARITNIKKELKETIKVLTDPLAESKKISIFARLMVVVALLSVLFTIATHTSTAYATYAAWYKDRSGSRMVYQNAATPLEAIQAITEENEDTSNVSEKLKMMQYEVVERVCEYESRMYKEKGFDSREALVIFDPDRSGRAVNIPSFGWCQFKIETVRTYARKYYDQELTQIEAMALAHDHDKAQELARVIMFSEPGAYADGGWGNWSNTVVALKSKEGYDVAREIERINEFIELWKTERSSS